MNDKVIFWLNDFLRLMYLTYVVVLVLDLYFEDFICNAG